MEPVINTLMASHFTRFMAFFFGRQVNRDSLNGEITVYVWRGKEYFFDYKRGLTL